MLITKEVEVNITSRNVKYYEEKGYYIPKVRHRGKDVVSGNVKIIVNINDLNPKSRIKIKYICDCCGKEFILSYIDYVNTLRDGKKYCLKCTAKLFKSGKNNSSWNPNRNFDERFSKRQYPEYYEFVRKVLERDDYTCKCCGNKNKELLRVHHLNGYSWDIENRTSVTNGITLCENCHNAFHSKYGRIHSTKEQFEEWIGISELLLEEYHGELPTARKIYCFEEDKIYFNAKDYAYVHKVNENSVYRVCVGYCPTLYGLHLKYYDDYLKMSQSEINDFISQKMKPSKRKVICLETKKVFDSISDGANKYNIKNSGNIIESCKNPNKSSGKLKDGTKLHWRYYEDCEELQQAI